MSRFALVLCAAVFAALCLEPTFCADAAGNLVTDPQTWVGTWTGTITSLDSHNSAPSTSSVTIVIAAKDIGKAWTVVGDSISKNDSTAGVQSRITLTRTGTDTCSLSSDGIGSGRGGFTRHTSGDLKRQ
jgi:hypothetical protein